MIPALRSAVWSSSPPGGASPHSWARRRNETTVTPLEERAVCSLQEHRGGRMPWVVARVRLPRRTSMMGRKARIFTPVLAVSLDALVPADHFYRHVERVLDLSFVRTLVQDCY